MAASFNGSSDYLRIASALGITGTTFTMAAWFRTDQLTADRAFAGLINVAGDGDGHWLSVAGTLASDPLQAGSVNQGVGSATSTKTSVASTSTWYHGCGRWSGGSFLAILDGGGGSGASPGATSSPDRIEFGMAGVLGTYHDGDLAAMAMWSVSLTDAEVLSLAKGFPPRRVRPQSLVCDIPSVRNVLQRKSAATALTINGTGVATHHRSYGY